VGFEDAGAELALSFVEGAGWYLADLPDKSAPVREQNDVIETNIGRVWF